jgi:hypothetical protein
MINKPKMLKSFMAIMFLMLATLGIVNDALATPAIFNGASGKGVTLANSCQTCHTGASGSESKGNLKTGYAAAWAADKTNYRKLQDLITPCPSAGTHNAAGVCVTPTPPPPTPTPCVLPKKVINGVCTTPPPTPTPCALPKKVINGVCTTPPPTPTPCVLPKKLVNGVCTTPSPTPTPCALPKKVINGVCTTPPAPPTTCKDDDDGDDDGDKNEHESKSKSGKCEKKTTRAGSVGEVSTGNPKTDVYAVTCGKGTSYLSMSVKDLSPVIAPAVSIQAIKGRKSSALVSDPVDGDDNYSPSTKLAKGAGVYMMKVNKTESLEAGAEAYVAKVNCRSKKGAKIRTKMRVTQNQ